MELTEISENRFEYTFDDLELPDGTFIAGGAIRDSLIGEDPKDIDVFGTDDDFLQQFEYHNDLRAECDELYETTQPDSDQLRLNTFYFNDRPNIQTILDKYMELPELLSQFDFTINQFAKTNDGFYACGDSIVDLYNRNLIFNNIESDYVLNLLERVQKFIQKGYTLCSGQWLRLVEELDSMDMDEVEDSFEFYPDGSVRTIRFD